MTIAPYVIIQRVYYVLFINLDLFLEVLNKQT